MKYIFILLITLANLNAYSQNGSNIRTKMPNHEFATASSITSFFVEKMFPNPAKDFVYIDIRSESSCQVQLFLFNILGAEIKKWEPNILRAGQQQIKIDVSTFKTGLYILKISGSGQVYSQVFKKN